MYKLTEEEIKCCVDFENSVDIENIIKILKENQDKEIDVYINDKGNYIVKER